ncbi:unnamed protein product [Moneuplotes crassus]|uniref:Uncharacterized protein n=1 Tax=Euplotes crassus TaxID=5936 RepID=A0AAD1XXB4_EUPCR|nr:unnamed protein product [Moneuplotes crassus]
MQLSSCSGARARQCEGSFFHFQIALIASKPLSVCGEGIVNICRGYFFVSSQVLDEV